MISGSSSIGSFTGFKAHEFVAHASKTNCVAIGPRSGQVLATGGDDKRVNVWRIGRASSIWSLTGNSSAIESLRFDPTEGFLVSGSAGGAVKLFDLSAGKMTRHFRGHMSNVTVIDCGSFDRRFVTTGSMDCQVKLWNVDTKECAMAFKGHNAEVTDVQFSPDGHILASAAADGQVKLWDLRAGKPMHTFQACSGSVRAIRFNPQEFLLAAATSDRTVKLYDIEFMELFCTTAPDTCPIRAITFDPDGQNMYCASPSGLRRWSWDNDTASARLEAMGDVPWGKVCAGALHYNADGRQLLASSCAGSRLSVWAVDFDEGAPRSSRPQQPKQQETDSAFEPDAAAVVSAQLAPTPTAAFAAAGSPATSQPNTPDEGTTATATTPDSSISPGGHESADAKIPSSRSTSKDRIEEQASRGENSHERGSKQETKSKESGEEPISVGNGGPPTFQVLGRQLPLLPTAAEVKDPPARPKGAEAATERATTPSTTVEGTRLTLQPAAAVVASLSAVAISGRGSGSNAFRNRRSSRAEAVAAAVAAVASAKAATDDAVASVSSSGRHRSIGTSISDTLVITAHPGGGGGGCGVGEAGAAIDGPDDRGGGNRGGQQQHRPVAAAWAEQAPGKEDESSGVDRGRGVAAALGVMAAGDRYRLGDERHTAARNNASERKWHKRVTGAFAGAEEAADDVKSGARAVESGDGRSGRGDGSNSWAMEVAEEKEAKVPSRRDEKAPTIETDEVLGATPLFTVNPWSRRSRNGGAAEAGQESRGRGGGGDSPPLLGSPEPSRADAVANAAAQAVPAAAAVVVPSASPPVPDGSNPQLMPSTSRRSPVSSRQREKTDAIVARSSTVGFPVATGDADRPSHRSAVDPFPDCASADGRNKDDQGDTAAAEGLRVAGMLAGGGDGGGELGMTRPRTATRRWDRPGPPGDDEVIARTLLSRAAVTSTLSNRLTHLRMLRSGWADGDISGTIMRLARLESAVTPADDSPRAVVADFLWVVPLEGARVTLEHCLELMPLLEGLWKLDADGCVAAATRCLESIVRRFGGFVRDTLGAPVAAGRVDLAREDRIARCREAHRAFIRGYHHLERSEGEFYEDRRIAAVAERLRPLFESYFMS